MTNKKTEKKPENMELWNSVCETDPKKTKPVDQRGGFTAICAQWQFKRATELWGPYGGKWGIQECIYGYVGEPPIEMWIEAEFYCPAGKFQISSDMKFRAGDDGRKKLLTDITTKALSKLGFNSDVFEGKFDDNKYIEKMNKKYESKDTPERVWLKKAVDLLKSFEARQAIVEWNIDKETVAMVAKLNKKQQDYLLNLMQECLNKFDESQTEGETK